MLRPQVATPSCVLVLMSMISASVICVHCVCLDIVFSGKACDAVSDHTSRNEEQEQTHAHGQDESCYPEAELLDGCDKDAPSSSFRADEALKTCE